jgi:cytochrome c oxidase accessory protein FixG
MEFIFRPIERFFDGAIRQKSRKTPPSATRWALKHTAFAIVAFLLGNVFLSYFVGVDRLIHWMSGSPFTHPTGFAVMSATAGLVFVDFAYFREQMCTVVCPYARLQSVLLDAKSLVVAYDAGRGEPRGKKGRTTGDCVDCKACVAVCPTGIDIRQGLQLECIACTQCIDACDGIMDKLQRPRGLIRYTSEDALAKGRFDKRALLRARTIAYPALFLVLIGVLLAVSGQSAVADVTVLRGIGAPFVEQGDKVQNLIRVKIRNRSSGVRSFHVSLLGASDIDVLTPEDPLTLSPRAQGTESVFLLAPRTSFTRGSRSIRVQVSDQTGYAYTTTYKLVGPEQRP